MKRILVIPENADQGRRIERALSRLKSGRKIDSRAISGRSRATRRKAPRKAMAK